ncbi:MAG: amino acid adenylation domain-containing protein [Chitinophagaceae bacterium]
MPLSPIQYQFFSNETINKHHYNQSVMLKLSERLNEDTLNMILNKLSEQHDMLRANFNFDNAEIIQVIYNAKKNIIPRVVDLRNKSEEESGKIIDQTISEIQATIDLGNGCLMQGVLFKLKDSDRLFLTIHHLVVDGISWRILLDDIGLLLEQHNNNNLLSLPPKTSSFKQWAAQLGLYANSEAFLKEREYWRSIEKSPVENIQRAIDSPENKIKDACTVFTALSKKETDLLLTKVHYPFTTEINDILLAALCRTINHTFIKKNNPAHNNLIKGEGVIAIALEGHGREQILKDININRTVGWFTSIYPVILTATNDLSSLIKNTKQNLRQIPNKGIGHGLLKYLTTKENKKGFDFNLTPQISFNYLGDFNTTENDHFDIVHNYAGLSCSPEQERDFEIEVSGIIVDKQLKLSIAYSAKQFKRDTIQNLLNDFENSIREIISYCLSQKEKTLTPADLTYNRLSTVQLDKLEKVGVVEDAYPLSPLQEGMFFHFLYDKKSLDYVEQLSYRLHGHIDIKGIEKSFSNIVSRHGILRTSFVSEDFERPLQIVWKNRPAKIHYKDLRKLSGIKQKEFIKKHKAKDLNRGFDLINDRLIRLAIFQLQDEAVEMVWSHHHIIIDGWCLSILIGDFFSFYNASLSGKLLRLTPATPYKNFIKWLEQKDKEGSALFWENYTKGYEKLSGIPRTDLTNKGCINEEGFIFKLNATFTSSLNKIAVANGVTLNTIVQAIWSILLSKYNTACDVLFGTVVSGRSPEIGGIETIMGLFINTIPLRVQIENENSFLAFSTEIQKNTIEREAHHHYPLADIQNSSPLKQNLLDHILVFENYPISDEINNLLTSETHADIKITDIAIHEKTNYDFNLIVVPGKELTLRFLYNSRVYDSNFIKHIGKHFEKVAETIIQNEKITLGEISILTDQEKQLVLNGFNGTQFSYPEKKSVVKLFENVVEKYKAKIALESGDTKIDYDELNKKANKLAHYLIENYNIKANDPVALLLDRSEGLIIAVLGVLKAGAAYVPIDGTYPAVRINHILQDSNTNLFITNKSLNPAIDNCNMQKLFIDEEWEKINLCSDKNIELNIDNDFPAYIVYTSGSTGLPKGVVMPHGALANLLNWQLSREGFDKETRTLQFSSISFDVSFQELFSTWLTGGTLVMINEALRKDTPRLLKFISDKNIRRLFLPFAALQQITESIVITEGLKLSLKEVITAGERLIISPAVSTFFKTMKGCRLYNQYGPSETHVITEYPLPADVNEWETLPPIGKPISNTDIYILDNNLNPLPVGVEGEIYAAGANLATGYLNNSILTSEKFIKNPFKEGFLYKTGDIGRWRMDGNIDCLGRKDTQTKIRGFRVELGEIESLLLSHEDIKEAVVVAKEDIQKTKSLAAYIIPKNNIQTEALKIYVRKNLPDYMLPSYFIKMAAFPLTSSGKIDRNKLPDPSEYYNEAKKHSSLTAQTVTEKKLLEIWKEILELKQISIDDNFFEIGGHSLKATRLASKIYRVFGINLALKTIFTHTTITALAQQIEKEDKQVYAPIPKAPEAPYYPVSNAQKRLWVLAGFSKSSVAYNMSASIFLHGKSNTEALNKAFKTLVSRHESLRTNFIEMEGEVKQVIIPPEDTKFEIVFSDLSTVSDTANVIDEQIDEAYKKPFDLSADPLIRVSVSKLEKNRHLLILTMHHIISDGWSISVLLKEFLLLYKSYAGGKGNPLAPLRIQYKDYTWWKNELLNEEKIKPHKEYWLKKFNGAIPVLEMPLDKSRPAEKTYNGDTLYFELNKSLLSQLKHLSRTQGCTLFMALLAVLKALLYKYTSQTDIVIGSPVAGRDHIDLENQVGFYVNTLALRTTFNAANSFIELMQKVKETTILGHEHQLYPFDVLVDALKLEKSLNRSPLFDIMCSLQDPEINNELKKGLKDIRLETYQKHSASSKFDMAWNFEEVKGKMIFGIEYNTDLFDKGTTEQLGAHFQNVLKAVMANPTVSLNKIEYLTNGEKRRLLNSFNNTKTLFPFNKSVVTLFDEQVKKTPGNIAVANNDGKQLSYKELQEKSNALAAYLQQHTSIESNDKISLLTGRSPEMIIGIMGILKAGAAYVPIEISYPIDRIEYMLDQANCKVVVTTEQIDLPKHRTIFIEDALKGHSIFKKRAILPDASAFVIFTSGSTGKPKGVEVSHRAIVNLVAGLQKDIYHNYSKCLKIALGASYVFDASVQQIFACLLNGHSLYIVPGNIKQSGHDLLEYLIKNKIDVTDGTPAHISMLVDADIGEVPEVKHYIIGGEALPKQLVKKFYALFGNKTVELPLISNVYGPTECCVDATHFAVYPNQLENYDTIPIGKPMANRYTYILDEQLKPVPIGVWGELYIGGEGLAKGYVNLPGQTAEFFTPNPFKKNERVYKTGDICRWLHDGNIAYMGRNDNQVKIRGYRIEPGEIENVLLQHPGVKEAVVLAKQDKSQNQYLVAYIVSAEEIGVPLLFSHLKRSLPDYMHPAHFVQLEKLPVNTNGKIDRAALLSLNDEELKTRNIYVAPDNVVEERLAEIWKNILQKDSIGTNESFFQIGGHSLNATRMVSMIHKSLHVRLSLRDIFGYPTIKELAAYIINSQQEHHIIIEPIGEKDYYEISNAQKRLWILSQFGDGSIAYNITGAFILQGNLHKDALVRSLETVVERHESLRTVFVIINDEPKQKIIPGSELKLEMEYIDLTGETDPGSVAKKIAVETAVTPFDLSKGPLLRTRLIGTAKNENILLVTMHHIISDAWSSEILLHEIAVLYNAFATGKSNPLTPLKIQYKDYAAWQRKLMSDVSFTLHRKYWLEKFKGEITPLQLPTDAPRNDLQTFNGAIYAFNISEDATGSFRMLSTKHETTMFMSLLAFVKLFLYKLTGQTDIIVGSSVAGRQHGDLNDQLGFYVNTLALRTRINKEEPFSALLNDVKNTVLEAYEHQVFPFDMLVDELQIKRNLSRSPIFDVMVEFSDNKEAVKNRTEFIGLKMSPFLTELTTSRFDLIFNFYETEGDITVSIEYNTDLFKPETMELMKMRFLKLAESILVDNDTLPANADMRLDIEKNKSIKLKMMSDTTELF